MGEIMHCVYLCEWHLNTFVELELAFAAIIVSLRFFGNGESQLESLSAQLILAQAFQLRNKAWTLSSKRGIRRLKERRNKGKDQVGDEREQSARHRTVLRSSTISPNDSKREDA
ncbi:hypothetical protein H5410_001837 [Solanum commersonii]|uniref:Uncharacterized protein n=1 Tax=Solanum commersonii TaxID=4109 RepID=A0A9J6B069_SOLCO|nr:hypothetical protein H5410_001837 [Solanum commersonii]